MRRFPATGLFLFGLLLAACGGGDDSGPAPSDGAGRAIPTEISDLRADCERGTTAACEEFENRRADGLSPTDRTALLCGLWGDLQFAGSYASTTDEIAEIAGAELPTPVAEALSTMASGSETDADDARDVVDEYFIGLC